MKIFLIMSVCLLIQGCAASVMSRQQYLQFTALHENEFSFLPSSYCGEIADGFMVSPLIPLPPIIPLPNIKETQRINIGFDNYLTLYRAYLRTNELKEISLTNVNIRDSVAGAKSLSINLEVGCEAADNSTLVLIFKSENAADLQLEWHIKYVIGKRKIESGYIINS
ncbi:hypothetical protein Rhein_0909 [Rheinheimera sp. A13L]|uniref:hypothetical protein n=1 Tax=Rheinheimera sp. A13L TaxID=506534 RepID=UPI0002124D14|nr:hypothetical protein [Rheinheimera sp. A13L]EGM79051.1 hypothetical protein Rhein_0909 [Rheinheimera sp. A13L]